MTAIRGVCAAIATPFDRDGERIDEERLIAHIDDLLGYGMHGLVICGGTGEFAMLREDEKSRLIELSIRHVNGRVPVVAQASAINTADTVRRCLDAEQSGADALMILPPYFEGPAESGVLYHFEEISKTVSVPVVLYNIPVHSGFNITPELYGRLLEFEHIEYIKDSTCDLVQLQRLINTGGRVLSGADPIQPFALMAGCVGTIWGAANVMPKESVELFELIAAGRCSQALELWRRMAPANLFLWDSGYGIEYNAAVKAACTLTGRDLGPCRKPVQPLGKAAKDALLLALSSLPYSSPAQRQTAS